MYLIDYEYSGNNDPMWDLSDLSVEGNNNTIYSNNNNNSSTCR